MTLNMAERRNLIKCSPTFKPQTVVSMMRLKEKLDMAGFNRIWTPEMGYIIRLGDCRAIFLSAEENSNVVGNTAHLLLEVDEAQDVSEEKYVKEFKPMGATTHVTNVLYGTTWDDRTLLEKMKQVNLEKERKDGIKRHFRYDWQTVAQYNEAYLKHVEGELERMGQNHPLFLTQYRLLPVRGGGGFFDTAQRAQLQGTHSRQNQPSFSQNSAPASGSAKIYVAGIDLAGEAETEEEVLRKFWKPKPDTTVITIGELQILPGLPISNTANTNNTTNNSIPCPPFDSRGDRFPILAQNSLIGNSKIITIKIVEHYACRGIKHAEMYSKMVDLLKYVWNCRSIVADATGIGQPVASFLRQTLGSQVIPFTFTAASKSALGFNLLAAINSGMLKMYAADNSPEYREFWQQMERAKSYFRASQTMNFYVDQREGHDDYLMSLALLVEAGRRYEPREARGR
jgi:hypothetical protein